MHMYAYTAFASTHASKLQFAGDPLRLGFRV
jgi:hypothetical protein